MIVVLPSDDAFGVINFTSSSLSKLALEGQTVNLELQRTGGALGPVTIFWEVDNFGDDLVKRNGKASMDTNQRSTSLTFTVRDDVVCVVVYLKQLLFEQ